MPQADAVRAVAEATTWDARVALIRRVPESFGQARHAAVYAAIAREVYVPNLAPDFACVHWGPEFELGPFDDACRQAFDLTRGFFAVGLGDIQAGLLQAPRTLRVFRLLLGFTSHEFAAATKVVADSGTPERELTRLDGPRHYWLTSCADVQP